MYVFETLLLTMSIIFSNAILGITKVPTGDQPEDVEEQIRRLSLG